MIRWVVGEKREVVVGKFPDESGSDNVSQPAVLVRENVSKEIELEVGADLPRFRFNKNKGQPETNRRVFSEARWAIKDKDGAVRFTGQPLDNPSSWCSVTEYLTKDGVIEYRVTPVSSWVQFTPETFAQKNAPNLEESEQLMKEQQSKIKTEFAAYLKERSRRAEELGIGIVIPEDLEPVVPVQKKTLKFKRAKKEMAEDEDWEGEQEFSDDDERDIAEVDEDAKKTEEQVRGTIEVDEEDLVDKDHNIDEEALARDAFGDDIATIMRQEQKKENIDEDVLDDELKQYASGMDEDDENDDEPIPQIKDSTSSTSNKRPLSKEPPMMARKVTKEDQIRARVKGMFWRNEYKLKLKDVLSQFPGLSRTSDDYQFLTKALKDLADVVDNVLHLKQQYRK